MFIFTYSMQIQLLTPLKRIKNIFSKSYIEKMLSRTTTHF